MHEEHLEEQADVHFRFKEPAVELDLGLGPLGPNFQSNIFQINF